MKCESGRACGWSAGELDRTAAARNAQSFASDWKPGTQSVSRGVTFATDACQIGGVPTLQRDLVREPGESATGEQHLSVPPLRSIAKLVRQGVQYRREEYVALGSASVTPVSDKVLESLQIEGFLSLAVPRQRATSL